jgi:hypothetical protein
VTTSEHSTLRDAYATHLRVFRSGQDTSFDVGILEIAPRFEPAIGFLPRRDVRRWNAALRVPWYVQTARFRRLVPGFSLVDCRSLDGRRIDAAHRASLDIDMQSDDIVTLFVERNEDHLDEGFDLFKDVGVPAGDYSEWRGGVALTSKAGRRLALNGTLSLGGFLGGTRHESGGTLEWKVDKHLTVSQFYGFNQVDVDDGRFDTHLLRSRLAYSLNTRFSISALVQFDNESERLGTNVRLQYILSEGTEAFLMLDDVRDDLFTRGGFGTKQRAGALLKLTYLVRY